MMKAIIVKEFGGPDSMSFQEIEDLKDIPGHTLIDVKEIGINFFETSTKTGVNIQEALRVVATDIYNKFRDEPSK